VAILDVASAQLTNLKSGHTEIARALAWSPDGQRVATGSDDKTAVIWDAAAAMVVKKLEHPCGVIAITWSHDAKWLATGGADQRIRIWDPSVGKLDRTFDPLPMTTSGAGLAWNADDSRLAAALADGSVVLVDVQSGKAGPAVLSVPGTAYDVQWSPDGTMLTASGGDGSAAVCDPQSGKRFDLAARFPGQDIAKTYWLPDSRRILLGCDFATVQQAYDVVADRPLGKMIVRISGDQWIVIGPEGHYRGTRKIDDHIVYVALTDDGRQETYTPSAFAAKFGWKNDPDKAWLLGEPAQQPVPAPMPSGKPQQPEPSSFGQPPAAPKSEPPSKPQAESKVTEPAATAPPSAPAP
jgi:WD40 repeat protein